MAEQKALTKSSDLYYCLMLIYRIKFPKGEFVTLKIQVKNTSIHIHLIKSTYLKISRAPDLLPPSPVFYNKLKIKGVDAFLVFLCHGHGNLSRRISYFKKMS